MFKLLLVCTCYCLLGWGWPVASLRTQLANLTGTMPPLRSSLVDSSHRVVLTTGKLKPMFSWELSPGGSYALRFMPPAAGPYRLVSIQLHLQTFGRHTAQGQVRLRVVGVAADGSPADENPLLPPRLISRQTLQDLDQPLVLLTWPAPPLRVTAAGFFVVIEGVGEAPDEYVIHSPQLVLAGKGYYQIGRRSQPQATPRQLSTWGIPSILGAKRTNPAILFWMRDGEVPSWRAYPESKQAPLLDVTLE